MAKKKEKKHVEHGVDALMEDLKARTSPPAILT